MTLCRGAYMSANVLLILLNELRKRDKMRDLSKFKYTRARMLDSIYHMTFRLLFNLISDVKINYNFSHYIESKLC